MKRSLKAFSAVSAAVTLSLTVAACGAANQDNGSAAPAATGDSGASVSGSLNGAGASTQTVAQETWKAAFETGNSGATVNYDPIGSGGGRKQFLSGASQFGGSDAYLKDDEVNQVKPACGELIQYPVYISPIAIAFNVKGVTKLQLDPQTLAKIFKGEIKTWDDAAIKATNAGVNLPSEPIVPVHRSDDSGTTSNFTDYLSKVASSVWTDKADGNWPAGAGGESAKGTQGLVQAIGAGEGYIGYADASQAGKLGVAEIKVGAKFQGPSAEAAAKIIDESPRVAGRGQYDFAIDLKRDTATEGVYPIVLASYQLACTKYPDKATANLAKAYLTYTVSAAGQQAAAKAAGNAPLSQSGMANAMKAINAISAG